MPADGTGRHRYRRRQFFLQGRRPTCPGAADPRRPLRRRRHQRRSVGPRARLLHDDRRRHRSGASTRSDFFRARARAGRHPAHAGPRRPRRQGGVRLYPLRSLRFRAFRQDGPQRHRVRLDAGICGGLQHSARRRRTSGRRALRARARRRRRGLAARQRDLVLAAGSHRICVCIRSEARELPGLCPGFRRRPLDVDDRDRVRRAGQCAVRRALRSAMRKGFGGHVEPKSRGS